VAGRSGGGTESSQTHGGEAREAWAARSAVWSRFAHRFIFHDANLPEATLSGREAEKMEVG